jgi:O-acetyl-ADP-ribose deacetylase (regulator of RNase III)
LINDPPKDDDPLDTILTQEEKLIKKYVTGYLKINDNVHLITLHLPKNPKKGGIIRAADILQKDLDVIVNAANASGIDGGAVDGAINKYGGKEMEKKREEFMNKFKQDNPEGLKVGKGFHTLGHGLGCKNVIHMNSFDYSGKNNIEMTKGDEKLKESYTESLRIADEDLYAKNIAFSLLSSGIFNGNRGLKEVLEIGIQAIKEYNASKLKNVFMVSYKYNEKKILEEVLEKAKGTLYIFNASDDKGKDKGMGKSRNKDKGSGSGGVIYKPCMEFTYNDDGSWCAKIVEGNCKSSVAGVDTNIGILDSPLITSNKCYELGPSDNGRCAKLVGHCEKQVAKGGGKSKKRKKISRRKMKRKRKQSKRRKKNRKTKKLI